MSPIKQQSPRVPGIYFSSVYRGTAVTLGVSLGLSVVAGLTYYFSHLSESTLPWLSAVILFLSVTCGSGYASRKAGSRGLYHGVAVGLMFFILIWLLAALFLPGKVLLLGAAAKLAISLVAGAIGGVLGVAVN